MSALSPQSQTPEYPVFPPDIEPPPIPDFPTTPMNSFYVSPNGSDANDGSEGSPVKTLARAQELVRARIADGLDANLAVRIKPGDYLLSEPLQFGALDSSSDYQVAWIGERDSNGNLPLMSGGERLPESAFTLRDATKNIYQAPLDVTALRHLYYKNEALPRARTPNVSNMGIVGPADAPRITAWLNNPYYQIQVAGAPWLPSIADGFTVELVTPVGWAVSRFPMLASAVSGGETFFSPRSSLSGVNPGWVESLKSPIYPSVQGAYGPFHLGTQKAYFEGHYTMIDQDLEWAYDKTNKVLYVKTDNPTRLQNLWVPKTEKLLVLENTKNLVFSGLRFAHASWNKPSDGGYIGFAGANYYEPVDSAGNLSIKVHPVAIDIKTSSSLVISGNQFMGLGASGIRLTDSEDVSFTQNQLFHISGTALIVQRGRRIRVGTNALFYIGLDLAGDAIQLGETRQTTIDENQISAIAGRGVYAIGQGYGTGVEIKNNKVNYVTTLITDAGAINTGGQFIITGNEISNAQPRGWNVGGGTNKGVYSDVFSYHSTISGNIITNVNVGVRRNCDAGSQVTGNIFTQVSIELSVGYNYCEPFVLMRPANDPWRIEITQAMAQ